MVHRYEPESYHEQRELADKMDEERTRKEIENFRADIYPVEEGIDWDKAFDKIMDAGV